MTSYFNPILRTHVRNGYFMQAFHVFNHMRYSGNSPDCYTIPLMAKAYVWLSSLREGKALHSLSLKLGVYSSLFVQTSILHMYSKCQELDPARRMFDEMSQRDTTSWNVFFTCLAASSHEVCSSFNLMRASNAKLDTATMVAVLQTFGTPHGLYQGMAVHCLATKSGLILDAASATSFISMYSKGGDLVSAWAMFEQMKFRDLITWNAMISGFCQNGYYKEAIKLFLQMPLEKISVDSTCLLTIVSALSHLGSLRQGRCVHAYSLKNGMDHHVLLNNSLVDLYIKCSDLRSAENLFGSMLLLDDTSWNPIIHGCLANGKYAKAATYLREMLLSGNRVDDVTLSCIVTACAHIRELKVGKSVHGWEIRRSGNLNVSVGNALITLYSKCGEIDAGMTTFEGLLSKDIVSWNSMIDGLVVNTQSSDALLLVRNMHLAGFKPDSITIIAILQLCAEHGLILHVREIHGLVLRRKFDLDPSVLNSLMDVYLKCEDVLSGELLFEMMPENDLVSWNTMIAGYSINKYAREAWELFCKLLASEHTCTVPTLLALIPSCDCEESRQQGMSLHCWMLKLGFSSYVFALNALLSMYINCGNLSSAWLLFEDIPTPGLVSWNTVIVGCTKLGFYGDALETVDMMRVSGIYPDSITIVSMLSSCGNLELLGYGMTTHAFSVKVALDSYFRVSNTLILMYCRCKVTEAAEAIFVRMCYKNICSWNSIISGLVHNRLVDEAVKLFNEMECEPNEITFVNMIICCTQLGDLASGKSINAHIFRLELFQNVYINASLVDMYSKCGRLDIAEITFANSLEKSVVSWNSLIAAYGFHGFGRKALDLFSEMCLLGVNPTKSTFINLLSACTHSGLVAEGLYYFNRMSEDYNVNPSTEHYVCMVDLLGKAGRMDQACEFIKDMKMEASSGILGALLSACKDYNNLELGNKVAEYLFDLDPANVGYYVSLSNMHAAAGNWSSAFKLREMMEERGFKKQAGWSSLDVCSAKERVRASMPRY